MNAKSSFAQLVRAEIENGATPQVAFANCRRKYPDAFRAVLMSGGMNRAEADRFIVERTRAK